MNESQSTGETAVIALLDSEITDLEREIERASAPFHRSWRSLAAFGGSFLVGVATLEFSSSYHPELPAVAAMMLSIIVLGLLLSTPERRRRRELKNLLAEARQARQLHDSGGTS